MPLVSNFRQTNLIFSHGTVLTCFNKVSHGRNFVRFHFSTESSFGPASPAFLARLSRLVPSALYRVSKGERRVKTTPENILPLLTFLKDHTGREFTQLRDITAIDRPERKRRFEVVYSLLSVRYRQRLRVTVAINELDRLPSVNSLFPSAGWYERETAERFGISFFGHPDLRRLRLDYGFKGHPLRKDFPATGYVEVRFDEVEKRIQYEEVSLAQEFRQFTLEGPWSAGA